MFTSIITTTTETLSITSAVVCMVAAIIMGAVIAFTYMKSESYSKNFVVTLVLLPVLVQTVIMLVNGNLGTGIAVVGAFSLVRFRSIPGSSKEISFIFFAMAVGLATGMGYLTFAAVVTVIICAAFFLLLKTSFGENTRTNDRKLRVTIPENLDYTDVFDDILEKYTKKAALEKVKLTNLGSMFELHYNITLRDSKEEKDFIDELRCRNGNLTIICCRNQLLQEEL
ncbi:MAG: hypothetical protein K0R92_1247 [Lachnospiraceae bacterium]|jgi:uncharacterized membrane protein YhiD involved in acid resistance|nr:hypothetical protein [Lachnospiraceae bacterium]